MILGCHHIELNVSDLDRSLEFYAMLAQFFPASSLEQGTSWFQWRFADIYIHFNQVQSRFVDVPYHRKRIGLDHVAFTIESRDEILALERFLVQRGIAILYPAALYGPRYFAVYFDDPDRIKFEFGANLPSE